MVARVAALPPGMAAEKTGDAGQGRPLGRGRRDARATAKRPAAVMGRDAGRPVLCRHGRGGTLHGRRGLHGHAAPRLGRAGPRAGQGAAPAVLATIWRRRRSNLAPAGKVWRGPK
ncbi:hypothetical protein Pden_0557 [Paracoccus denitrificans PD1222]|uniref:Uncharacterized protein n=1 Tax=Paracoccus denitrificans (strain Pd 1222) TaxID=318586 RepID=A1AZH5_PARDP|nr:hypothetical protein Pden_0557 [Paracoccus denitrificans PD1222]